MRIRRAVVPFVAVLAVATVACEEDNIFRGTSPFVVTSSSQVWQLGLEGFPSAYDFATARRFFVGAEPIGAFDATWVLDERADGTLVFRPYSIVAPAASLVRVGIQDLGAVPFESVAEAPAEGYSAVDDSTGVAVVEGHVYAFRISRITGSLVPINYAKLAVTEVGQQLPGDPDSRFIRFEWAYQVQPLNRDVVVED
ncbi:MAG TPA: hypothetical protein VM778_10545 [Gemmatimonadota bacterium]|nr:hypothetical protein [Gemmatimonadota bacterium]